MSKKPHPQLLKGVSRPPRGGGLSTGKAAEYCLVTGDTILNWIRSDKLPAQRTAGGQYRVRLADLRRFMVELGMSVDELDRDFGVVPSGYCWEFHRTRTSRCASDQGACDACIVRQALARNCYELRKHADHLRIHCERECSECDYCRACVESTA